MRNNLLQYPNLFEPLEPIAAVAIPTIDGWGQPTNEPLRFPQKLVLENYITEILEPTLFIIPEFPDWYQQTNEPVRTKAVLVNEGWFTLDYAEIIVAIPVPAMDSWFRPASEPVLPLEPQNRGSYVSTLEPSLFVVPAFDWIQSTNEPVLPLKQPLPFSFDFPWEEILPVPIGHNFPDWFVLTETPIQPGKSFPGYSVEPLEPTLFVIPNLDSWFKPLEEPVLPKEPLNRGSAEFILEPTFFVIPTLDSWFRPLEEPTLPVKPTVNEGQSLAILDESLFTAIPVIIVLPPFCIDAQQTYIAGAVTGEGYTAGAIKIQQYGAGPKTQDGDC